MTSLNSSNYVPKETSSAKIPSMHCFRVKSQQNKRDGLLLSVFKINNCCFFLIMNHDEG